MSSTTICAIAAIVMLVLLFLKVPVYISVLGGSAIYFILAKANPIVYAQQAITGVESISLLAIPFFVCAGIVMNYTGVTSRIMDFCSVLTGRMTGDGEGRLFQSLFNSSNGCFLHDHTADPAGNRHDPLRMYRQCFHR